MHVILASGPQLTGGLVLVILGFFSCPILFVCLLLYGISQIKERRRDLSWKCFLLAVLVLLPMPVLFMKDGLFFLITYAVLMAGAWPIWHFGVVKKR